MGWFKASLLAGVLGAAPVTALGADVLSASAGLGANLPIHDERRFDWTGFYAGIYGVGFAQTGATSGGLGIQAGVNAQFDFFLVGAEVSVQGLAGDAGSAGYGELLGRAGLVVTDDVVVYAAGGYGLDLSSPRQGDVLLGGGVEMAVTDSVSVEAQYLQGLALDGGDAQHQISFGANFHF